MTDNDEEEYPLWKVKAMIVKRRSMGKKLAFCDIVPQSQEDAAADVISVAFRIDSWLVGEEEQTAFPVKNSSLPYGIEAELWLRPATREGPKWEVVKWKLGHDEAKEMMSTEKTGFSCSEMLQVRYENYAKSTIYYGTNDTNNKMKHEKRPKVKEQLLHHQEDNNHSQSKSLRAKIFAQWVIEMFDLSQQADPNDGIVLDVAGGKGGLSMQLSLLAGVACTVIDPALRKLPKMKHLKKLNRPIPTFETVRFQKGDDATEKAAKECTLLLGLHPDEPTEDIVNLALAYHKSFAVVPCCVFPSFFPSRILRSGIFVNTYEQFIQYLLEKDDRIKETKLSMVGKNRVVYLRV